MTEAKEEAKSPLDLADAFDEFNDRSNQGVEIQIRHPVTNEPLDLWVTVVSFDSDQYKAAERRISEKRLSGQKTALTVADMEADSMTRAVALVKDWRGVVLRGEQLKCTVGNVRSVFSQYKFIREQVAAAAGNRATFFPE